MESLSYAVVGGGIQGRVAASDLASRPGTNRVLILDARKPAAPAPEATEFLRLDVVRDAGGLRRALKNLDGCLIALPGSVADQAVAGVVAAGLPTVDVSFTPEVRSRRNARAAQRAGVPLIRDVGVAPGLSHILAASAEEQMGGLSQLTIFVGGLPATPPRAAFRHAVYFNALDLLSEYLRPARLRRDGVLEAPDPLDPQETRQLDDGDLGRLEAFPSDGLRSLLTSYPGCREMVELTLRWPGHLRAMRRLASAGKLEGRPNADSPLNRTAESLARHFPGERIPDVLLLEIHAHHRGKRRAYRVIDRALGGITGMSRTTAFTATAALHALALGIFSTPGEHPPEVLGKVPLARGFILEALRARGVAVERRSKLEPTPI